MPLKVQFPLPIIGLELYHQGVHTRGKNKIIKLFAQFWLNISVTRLLNVFFKYLTICTTIKICPKLFLAKVGLKILNTKPSKNCPKPF